MTTWLICFKSRHWTYRGISKGIASLLWGGPTHASNSASSLVNIGVCLKVFHLEFSSGNFCPVCPTFWEALSAQFWVSKSSFQDLVVMKCVSQWGVTLTSPRQLHCMLKYVLQPLHHTIASCATSQAGVWHVLQNKSCQSWTLFWMFSSPAVLTWSLPADRLLLRAEHKHGQHPDSRCAAWHGTSDKWCYFHLVWSWTAKGHLEIPKHAAKLFVSAAFRDGVCFLSLGTWSMPGVALLGPMVWPALSLSCLTNTLHSPETVCSVALVCVSCCLGPVGCEMPCLSSKAVSKSAILSRKIILVLGK